MEMEIGGGKGKPLTYKIKAMSRETSAQKAIHILDPDLRNHWSTGTNTKEWILLELNEPCLLSQIRIHNKSVLEWEIAVGLRYKPETFVKVRPRCEALRRDVVYSVNYTPCRYVRLSCLRGSPIAIFFIQLIGISVPGLEPEFQTVVNYLLPHISNHEQDSNDMRLQLLQEITDRLHAFLPQLESELTRYDDDDSETSTRFLAMLAGPFYPILQLVSERETARSSASGLDSDVPGNSQPVPALTVSSNFEPRKSRNMSPLSLSSSRSIVFRPDAIFILLRKAFADNDLGAVCKVASRILYYLSETTSTQEDASFVTRETSSLLEEVQGSKSYDHAALSDYSELFGNHFLIPVIDWNPSYVNVLDIRAVEEGVLHVLYACASQPLLCSKLAESAIDFWLALPLIQAMLPALRPTNSSLSADEIFSQWTQPIVQQALSKIVLTLSSSAYHPLLHGCAGYLSSFSPSHVKTACVLIDLCSGSLAPWMPRITAKIDLAVELLEDLLGVIQGDNSSLVRVQAALKYVLLALSGYMDDVLAEYKEAKFRVLFLVEMLETFLEPAFSASQSMISSAEVSYTSVGVQEDSCNIALQLICAAVKKPSVLPSLEQEWRLGSVPPSVLLSILDPHLQLMSEIDFCKPSKLDKENLNCFSSSHGPGGGTSLKSTGPDDGDGVMDVPGKVDVLEDVSFLFAPEELKNLTLANPFSKAFSGLQSSHSDPKKDNVSVIREDSTTQVRKGAILDSGLSLKFACLHLDQTQLLDYELCKSRASEFQRLALDLHSQKNINLEGHNAAIDALILSAECYINPFMISVKDQSVVRDKVISHGLKYPSGQEISELRKALRKGNSNLEIIGYLEKKRDKVFVQILLEAAEMDRSYYEKVSDGDQCPYGAVCDDGLRILAENDVSLVDAITLVRRNQDLLCNFLIHQLQREKQSLHETLLQSLVFLLSSATKLVCPPEKVIDIILVSAEHLNKFLTSTLHQYKEGTLLLVPERIYRVQRHWMILHSLVVVSSGGSSVSKNVFNASGCQYSNLIPPSAWMCKIPKFSSCAFPLVRYLGWMAVSRNAKGYLSQRLFLASNLSQLTNLLSIFADDLAVMDIGENCKLDELNGKQEINLTEKFSQKQYQDQLFTVIYPDLSILFPDMQKEFKGFRETILEAVALQLRSLTPTAVPDILCWFSDLCLSPFLEKPDKTDDMFSQIKGFHAKNVKAIVMFVLEAIISGHMEAVIPEMPRLVQVLGSLCRSSYCDTPFLRSLFRLVKPVISYSLRKSSNEEKHLHGDSCVDFESLCFNELFTCISEEQENLDSSCKRVKRALVIFILASVFSDLSFDRKREVIQSSLRWVDFPISEQTTTFYDYLCSFQQLLQSCNVFFVQQLKVLGLIPMPNVSIHSLGNNVSKSVPWFPDDFCYGCQKEVPEKSGMDDNTISMVCTDVYHPSLDEVEGLCSDISSLISKLIKTIESSWNLHPQLCRSLTVCCSQSLMYSKCVVSVLHETSGLEAYENDNSLICKTFDEVFAHWKIGLEGLADNIILVQEKSCWEVASMMVDCILRVPTFCSLDSVVATLSSVIEKIMFNAPMISWRLQIDRWLSNLFSRGILMHESGICLIELLSKMLNHPEPEQHFTALLHLGRLFGLDVNGGWIVLTSTFDKLASQDGVYISESVLFQLVSSTWDQVTLMSSIHSSLHLRTIAKALLVHYIPYAERAKLQSFLETSDTLFQVLGNFTYTMGEGLFTQLSLALIAGACLYCPAEDILLVPHDVWRYIENLGGLKDGKVGEMEKRICQALCKVKHQEEEAKEALKEALSSCPSKELDPELGNTRESVLQVLANLTSVQSYFDIFSEKMDQEARELEEAEMEMEILQKDVALLEDNKQQNEVAFTSAAADVKDVPHLQQIKDGICSLEKSRIKEDIIERRQKKFLLRRRRQKYLEEGALREAELLQELDRQRALETEKKIERLRLLELERSKTNELRYSLDLEKEKQTQREIQRELEQVEAGNRPPRREFSSSAHGSRPRDRYRDRDNGRSSGDGSLKASNTSLPPDMPVNSQSHATTPTIVLSSSRTFSAQPPTILQARDRGDECGSSYEENFEGNKDSGDTGSTGDPELGLVFDGLSGGFGSSQRHGSRGSKSRQILERRDRDGRREGKWERKHS